VLEDVGDEDPERDRRRSGGGGGQQQQQQAGCRQCEEAANQRG
jgi:hypothetical protein